MKKVAVFTVVALLAWALPARAEKVTLRLKGIH
jgi:hypothetical protein